MKAAIVTPAFWPEVRRGAERFAYDLARELDIPVVTASPGPRVQDGVRVVRVPRAPGESRLRRRLFEDDLTSVPGLHVALRRARPDAVVATHAVAAIAAQGAGIPVIYAYMGIPHRAALANRRGRTALVERAIRNSAAVTALSEFAARGFAHWLGVDALVVPPGVDLANFNGDGSPRDPDPTVVCAADAREPRKRVDLLLEAFEIVRRARPAAKLVLDARTGPRQEGVELAPMDDRAALAALYRRAWVSALPSWGEAFGLVLAEALACGTTVVGANRDGIPEVLGDAPVGYLFDGDDPAALAAALLSAFTLATDPETPAACRARAETFSTARCAATYASLLQDAARGA